MVKNKALEENEKRWLDTILSQRFFYREEVIRQINGSEISRNYTDFYLSLKFKIDKLMMPIGTNTRIPVEMVVYRPEKAPVQFLLHMINGYISELEIFNADSSKINKDEILTRGNVEILVNEQLKLKT